MLTNPQKTVFKKKLLRKTPMGGIILQEMRQVLTTSRIIDSYHLDIWIRPDGSHKTPANAPEAINSDSNHYEQKSLPDYEKAFDYLKFQLLYNQASRTSVLTAF